MTKSILDQRCLKSMQPTVPPQTSLITPAAAERLAQAPDTLALIGFGGAREADSARGPWIETGLEQLAQPRVQLWRAPAPVEHGRAGCFVAHTAPGIALLAASLSDREDLEQTALMLYSELFVATERLACPHLLRIWQYLPRITEPWHSEDRYRAFCAGRRRAFEAARRGDDDLPAACLLGDDGDRILLYALALARRGRQIENPRQRSAYRYPPRYGRKRPAFSRSIAAGAGSSERLFISGTASITGHASRHTTTLDQLEETLRNLEALVRHWRKDAAGLAAIAPLKVYLRHHHDLEAVRDVLAARLPENHPITYLRADVCRPELKVEIEGVVQPLSAECRT